MPSETTFSDGPDRIIGGINCPSQHDGEREGHKDHCCCCDPCRYIRPHPQMVQNFCCRCVPRLICMKFTPDEYADECCREIGLVLFPTFTPRTGPNDPQSVIEYSGNIEGMDVSLRITKDDEYGSCYWEVTIDDQYVSSRVDIDHVNVSCLSVPDITVSGVVDTNGCTGTISFQNYDAEKVPFENRFPNPEDNVIDMVTPIDPQCDCYEVPSTLCVDGIRHIGATEVREQVIFTWNEDLGDRWSYMPCDGDITLDQEHIYLRGDAYGNCYLELDFEQTGSDTNDWATPPNTLGPDIHEIRDGMIPIDSCGCDLHAYSAKNVQDDFRFVYISARKNCSCWNYKCGSCRCVPKRVCVIGEIDGESVVGEAVWNGSAWAFEGTAYVPPFTINIGPDDCGDCVLSVDGDFDVPLQPSFAVDCGEYLSGEMFSIYDEYFPSTFNWLWVSATVCGCIATPCATCSTARCGGMPLTLFYEIQSRATPTTGIPPVPNPYWTPCDITVELHYWQRLVAAPGAAAITCGYVGYKTVTCPPLDPYGLPQSFVVRVTVQYTSPGSASYRVDRADLIPTPNGDPIGFYPIFDTKSFSPMVSCEPFFIDKGWSLLEPICEWGCSDEPQDIREMFLE